MSPIDGATPLTVWWQGLTMELKNALTTSSEASLLSKHIAYCTTAASQGSEILPSSPANPNSSCAMLSSSPKTAVPRYASGTSNRLPSEEYTTQWPLPATDDVDASPAPTYQVCCLPCRWNGEVLGAKLMDL
ncbi:hypothetical protein GQ55_2G365200 [Panicum hallii var. hallii]|uniref:Uncharacterized protein n=2 Tax=Panicum hallii var. hallii TaxID=1504633 RepID=A0A2T7EW77_9POAL|nr:hypothetical protein GQ55_2G365200 [Panicum hallii var. hallii]